MSWYVYAFIAAILTAVSALIEKRSLLKEHAMEFSAVIAILNLAVCIPLFFLIDYSTLSFTPLMILFFASILGAIAFLLVAKSLRHMEVSDASPLLVMGPGMTAIVAFIVLGESISLVQIMGILLLIVGSYVLELKNYNDIWQPFRIMVKSKYIHFILVGLFLYAITATVDRIVLFKYQMAPDAYMAFVHLFIAFHFIIMMHIFHDGFKGISRGLKHGGWWIMAVAVLTVGYRFAQAEAVKAAYVALVSAIKRMSGLFATVIGGELFHEQNLLRKSIACIIMIGGVLLIVL